MESKTVGVQKYFESVSQQWDALYSHEAKGRYIINKWLRKALYKRYKLAFSYCSDLTDKIVLDIGCGSGRYSIDFAKRGARKVVGIDFAHSMIDLSKKIAKEMYVENKCEFIYDEFLNHEFKQTFDIIVAMGFFDYIKDPRLILNKISGFHPAIFVASFPKFNPIWSLQRWIRYNLIKKCPVYNYSKKKLDDLYRKATFDSYEIIPCGTGYFVVANNHVK